MNNVINKAQLFFGRLWNSLTQPHPSLTNIAEQRYARLASSFLLTILALSIVAVIVRIPRLGLVGAFLGPFASVIGVLFVVYLISRSQWYRGAVFLFSLSFSALGYLNMIQQGNQTDFGAQALIYVPISLIVASSFLAAPTVFLLVGLNVGAYFSIQAFGITLPENIGAQIGIITVMGLLLMLLTNFRNNIERIRLAEIQSTNRELETLTAGLEQRVAERTQALSTVAEVSSAASAILETDKLLQSVADLTKKRFGLYHAHIYLLDEAGENLVLTAGAGEPGRIMAAEKRSIPLNREQSLVARAARERGGVTVNDVTQEPDFLPNPLLPDTRAELAVPMMVGEKVIGVFDVQSEVVGRFTDADIDVQTTLASQIASAIQNARSYTEVQRSQALLSDALRVARIGNWEYDLEKDLFTFNDHFYSIFRTSVEKVGGYRISSADYARIFVHPDDAALVGAEIQKSIESKERFFQANLEHRIIFADGEIGYITVNINLERDENGKIIRWYGANQDVTERRQLEEQNRHRAEYERNLNLITQKIQGTTSMEEALKITARELGHILHAKTVANLEAAGEQVKDVKTTEGAL